MFWRSFVWRSGLIATGVGVTLLLLLLLVSTTARAAENPAPGATAPEAAAPSRGAKAAPDTLDLNQATVAQLMTLPGVGPSKARAIVEQRDKRPYQRVSDLMRIKGIGRRTFMRLKPYLRVGPAPTQPVQEG